MVLRELCRGRVGRCPVVFLLAGFSGTPRMPPCQRSVLYWKVHMSDPQRVQIVASSETFLKMLRFYFTKAGYEVETVRTAEQALRFRNGQPDAVITEENLDGMDGLQLVRQLRASPVTARVQIMVLASTASDSKVQAVIAPGANECMRPAAKGQDIRRPPATKLPSAEVHAPRPPGRLPPPTLTAISPGGGSRRRLWAPSLGAALV